MKGGSPAAVEVEQLRAGYGRTVILDGIDLAVATGEFVAILGSSGCGKTTLLRTVAGFQKAMGGKVRGFGRDMTNLPPERRDVATRLSPDSLSSVIRPRSLQPCGKQRENFSLFL